LALLEMETPPNPGYFDDLWDDIRLELLGKRKFSQLSELSPHLLRWSSSWASDNWWFWKPYWAQESVVPPLSSYDHPFSIGVALGSLEKPRLEIPLPGPSLYDENWSPRGLDEDLGPGL